MGKFFLFILISFQIHVLAQIEFQGSIRRTAKDLFLVAGNQSEEYVIYSTLSDKSTESALGLLETGDIINGVGSLKQGRLIVEDIDFVALKRLLGIWYSIKNDTYFDFQNYNILNIWQYDPKLKEYSLTHKLQYVLTPDGNRGWKIFIGNIHQVHVGMLIVNKLNAQISFETVPEYLPSSEWSFIKKSTANQDLTPIRKNVKN